MKKFERLQTLSRCSAEQVRWAMNQAMMARAAKRPKVGGARLAPKARAAEAYVATYQLNMF